MLAAPLNKPEKYHIKGVSGYETSHPRISQYTEELLMHQKNEKSALSYKF
jgi:hypothetical protein